MYKNNICSAAPLFCARNIKLYALTDNAMAYRGVKNGVAPVYTYNGTRTVGLTLATSIAQTL